MKTKANKAEVLLQGLNQQIKSLNDTMRETENKAERNVLALNKINLKGSETYVKMFAGTLELKGGSTYTRGNVFALNSRGRMGPVRIVTNLSLGD